MNKQTMFFHTSAHEECVPTTIELDVVMMSRNPWWILHQNDDGDAQVKYVGMPTTVIRSDDGIVVRGIDKMNVRSVSRWTTHGFVC